MPVTPGTRFGPYELATPIGAGGMGEVYLAKDTNLKRDVAIKLLPESLASDADRLARFQREAEVLASLNHANIAHVYGLEKNGDMTALVMELVEGPTLAERIAQGPMPSDEALGVAMQIAEALEAAHARGIVHRDLKPANVKLSNDGAVKVLDFGIAKALDTRSLSGPDWASLTTPAMTQAGIVLGTAAYMSPEQARGKGVDQRADIWAFGCVLYEMLTGQPAFGGEDVTITLARVLERDADIDALPATLSSPVRQTIELCLQKDPRRRLHAIGDVRLALQGAFAGGASTTGHAEPESLLSRRRAAPLVAGTVLGALIVAAGVWMRSAPPAAVEPLHATIAHPAPETVGGNFFDANLAISPDGRYVAYVASDSPTNDNTMPLYVRALDRPDPERLSISARTPFFSPDGQWVGFVENNRRLSKVAVTGGPAIPIGGNANAPRGASWGPDDTIVFATSTPTGLMRISANGGDAEILTTPDAGQGETDHVYPQFLPGGRYVLFTIQSADVASSMIAVLDLQTRDYRIVIRGGSYGRYSSSGHIVYGIDGRLRAVAFDLDRLEIAGTPMPVIDSVITKRSGAASFDVADDGTLAYIRGRAEELAPTTLVWKERTGSEEPLGTEPRNYGSIAISPDGARIAAWVGSGDGGGDIWVWSVARSTLTRLTFAGANYPVWTPDGNRIAYGVPGEGLYWRAADGTGAPEALLEETGSARIPNAWTPDGDLLFEEFRADGGRDLYALDVAGDRTPRPVLASPSYDVGWATISRDGRWLA